MVERYSSDKQLKLLDTQVNSVTLNLVDSVF